jgi:coproporphyrinogen III oxidase-like Fe-S oxidoreductase
MEIPVTVTERLMEAYLRRSFARQMHFELGTPLALPDVTAQQPRVLYLHIPFCESLCPFCSFHRVLLNQLKATTYFRALRQELRIIADKGYQPDIVYVGGGTPTILPEELARTLELVRSLFPVRQVSVETNPNHLREDVLTVLKAAAVDRLSVGIQTFDDGLLRNMGRYESYGSGDQNRERLRFAQGWFGTLNADMIFNLPGQSETALLRDLDILIHEVRVDQASIYPLMTSMRTVKAMSKSMGPYSLRNEKPFFDRIRHEMAPHYQLSSVWCYSRNAGLTDEYIISNTSFIGAGSGAFSYLDGVMYANTFSINRYARMIHATGTAVTAHRVLQDFHQARYDLVMALFGLCLHKDDFLKRYGGRFFTLLWKEFLALRLAGTIVDDAGEIRLTRRGQYHWVIMMREFFNGVNNFRDQMRDHVRAERDMPDRPAHPLDKHHARQPG